MCILSHRDSALGWQDLHGREFLAHNGDFRSEDAEYAVRKDIVIPPALDDYFEPVYIDERILARRPQMAMFGFQAFSASIANHRGSNYSGGVRQWLAQYGTDTLGFYMSGVRADDYLAHMRDSLFCLAPEGWHP